jgi:ATP-dependent Clp protease ATP-binding subunit ClpC
MFERYTEKARRIIFFARYEASQYGSPYIEIAHLIFGLLREDFATIRAVSTVEPATLRQALEPLCQERREKIATSVDLPLSHPAKRVLAYGAEEAELMGHKHIGPEHLLIGVLRENGPEVAVLGGFGITLDASRAALRTDTGSATADPSAARQRLGELVARIPEDRLVAAARLLAALSSEFFAADGISATGGFSFSFGNVPPLS